MSLLVNGRRHRGQMAFSFRAWARQSEQKKWPQLVTVLRSAVSVQMGQVYMSSCSASSPARHSLPVTVQMSKVFEPLLLAVNGAIQYTVSLNINLQIWPVTKLGERGGNAFILPA